MLYKRNTGILFMIVGVGLLIFTIVIVIMGISRSNEKSHVMELDVTVEATVTDDWSETHNHKSKSGGYSHTTYYYGSVEYVYHGNRYTNPKVCFDTEQIIRGKTVTMYIDPDDPSVSFYSKEKDQPFFSLLSYLLFAFFGSMALFVGYKMFKDYKRERDSISSNPYNNDINNQDWKDAKTFNDFINYDPITPYSSDNGFYSSDDNFYSQNNSQFHSDDRYR